MVNGNNITPRLVFSNDIINNTYHTLRTKVFTDPVNSIISLFFMGFICVISAVALAESECVPHIAYWTVLPFAFATFNCFFGAAVEIYLIATGRPFGTGCKDVTIPMNIRRSVIPFVTATKFFFIMIFCLGTDLQALFMYTAMLFAAFVSPMEFLRLPHGAAFSKVLILFRLVVIVFHGPTFGGFPARIVLLVSELIPLYCVQNVNHHTASGSTIFHILNGASFFSFYLAIDMVQIAAGHKCYAQGLEAEMHFPIIIFILAVAAGIGLGLFLDKKTKEGYTEIEGGDDVDEEEVVTTRGADDLVLGTTEPAAFPGVWF
jgi:hypothetical protein